MDQQTDKEGKLKYHHGKTYQYDAMTGEMNEVPNPFQDIVDFHVKFGLTFEGSPRHLPDDLAKFRVGFLAEELGEYCFDHEPTTQSFVQSVKDNLSRPQTLEKQLDALVDLMYVLLGTAYLQGFPMAEAWRRVHAANMKKVRTTRAVDSARASMYDVIKPAGWTPPVLTDLV